MRFLIPALLCGLPAAAFAQGDMQTVSYACANDASFQVAFINTGEDSFAVMQNGQDLVPMKIALSGSGARYLSEDGGLELWTKGPEATVSAFGETEAVLFDDCTEMDAGQQPG